MRESGFGVSGGGLKAGAPRGREVCSGPGPGTRRLEEHSGAGRAPGAAGAGESNQGRGLGVSKKNPAESLLSMGEDGYDGSRYPF